MNDWLATPVQIDARAAALIAKAMRQVACADGLIHQRELNLIAAFEAEVGPTADPADEADALGNEALETAFLRSIIMVALADGVISEAELTAIRDLATEQGLQERVDTEVLSVKRQFLSVFAGVNVFRDAVVRVATDLGLSERELAALSGDA